MTKVLLELDFKAFEFWQGQRDFFVIAIGNNKKHEFILISAGMYFAALRVFLRQIPS